MIARLRRLGGIRPADLAVDLGTSATRIAVPGRGVVAEWPSVVAVHDSPHGKVVVAVGVEARKMLGRTPAGTEVVRPVREGVVVDFEATEHLLRKLLGEAGRMFLRPRVLVCVSPDLTAVERKAVQESLRAAGARSTVLVSTPMAAAIGAELPVARPLGSMIVDVGAGRTHIAVVSLGGTVVGRSVRIAGDAIDAAIVAWLRDEHALVVGDHTAEAIKHKVGAAFPIAPPLHMRIRGRDLAAGVPREVDLDTDALIGPMSGPIGQIRDALLAVLRDTPPEVASDILQRGIILCGGSAKIRGLDRVLRDATGLPVVEADDPTRCAARGAALLLEDEALYERIVG